MINLKLAKTDDDVKKIADLAKIIWHECYTPIIGTEQVEYMIEKFQSPKAISDAIKNDGYIYYMAYDNDALAGFIGVKPENNCVFLSKIYVDSNFRKRGIAKTMISKIMEEYSHKDYMYLTVNKQNTNAINTYKTLGFSLWQEQVADIGNGFVMDDYVFKYDLK